MAEVSGNGTTQHEQTLKTSEGFCIRFWTSHCEPTEGGRRAAPSIIFIEGLRGDLPEELDSLLTTDSVVRVSLGASEWASDDKVTPAKVAQSIVELADFLYLDSFCILAAAGAGTVALACAKLLTETRLKSVGIIAGLGCPVMNSGLHSTKWFCWDAELLPWLAPLASRLSCLEMSQPLILSEPATPPRSPSWSSPFSTPVCPSSLSKALISSRKKRVASEASLSTMSLPTSPKLAVSGRTRRGLDLANLADALIVDRLRTAILDGLKERQADGVHTNLALSGGIYRRPVSFSVNDMLAKVLGWTLGGFGRNPVEMGRINKHRLSSSHSRQNLSSLPADDSRLSLSVDHTTIIVEHLVEAPVNETCWTRQPCCEASLVSLSVPPVVPTTLVTAAAL